MFKTPTALQVTLATIVPIVVAVWATPGTMLIGERYGMGAVPFVLVGLCMVLLGSAAWLNHVLFHRVATFLPFLAAVVTALLIWFWQRHAFTVLVPNGELTYGYFLKSEGAKARFWVLSCPFWVGLTCLSVSFVAALVSGWRAGARRTLACMIPWWLTAFLIFALPSMYLDGQGNASIFI